MTKRDNRTVLFAWELGANFGHIKPMVAIARSLAKDGIRAVFAVRDLGYAREIIEDGEFAILQAPLWPNHKHGGHNAGLISYVDLLTNIGFIDPSKIAAVVAAWDALIDLVQPDVVVVDHAPGLMAALYQRGLPSVAIGTPFTMPPLTMDRLPPLRADQAPAVPEAQLMASVRAALGVKRAPAANGKLVDLFRTDERIVFGMPELDPYRSFRREEICLPPERLAPFVEAAPEPKVFVYFGGEAPHLTTFFQGLVQTGIKAMAYLRGDVGSIPYFLKRKGVTLFEKPPELDQILPQVSHVISQGGAFMSQAAITAGRPHLIMPLHGETELNLRNQEQLGMAQSFEPSPDEGVVARKVLEFVRNPVLLRKAREASMMVAARGPQTSGLEQAVAAIKRGLWRADQRSARLPAAAAALPS